MITSSTKSPVVLMAEDDPDDRLLAKDALSEAQIDVELHFVENGEELLDYLWHRGRYSEASSSPRPGRSTLVPSWIYATPSTFPGFPLWPSKSTPSPWTSRAL